MCRRVCWLDIRGVAEEVAFDDNKCRGESFGWNWSWSAPSNEQMKPVYQQSNDAKIEEYAQHPHENNNRHCSDLAEAA